MKKRVLAFLAGIFFYLTAIPNAKSQTVELNFDFESATAINGKLSGFNTGPTFNEMFEPSPGFVSIVNRCALFPPPFDTFNDFKIISFTPKADLVEKTAAIKPATLRFPGGTIANFYHIYEYSEGTYDPDSPVFAAGCGTQDVETSILGGVIREQYCKKDARVILDDPETNPNYINGFANYVLAVEASVHESGESDYKVDVIYVPNVFAHFESRILATVLKADHLIPSDPSDPLNIADPNAVFELYYKECKDALDYLIDRDINVAGVEFGNELFFGFYRLSNSNVTPETYMALCDIYSQRLEIDYPDMKFGVLSEPSSPSWNNPVSDYSPVFYDAVVLHDYYNQNTCITEDAPCEDGCPDDFTTDRTCRFDCGKCALGDYTRHDLKPEFSDALEGFPAETKLWLTEWGIISPGAHTGNNLDYMNTFLYSCFNMEHLMQQLEFNALEGNRIEFSTHHRIGYHNRWSVIQARLGLEESTIQSNFYTYRFFEKIALAEEAYHYEGASITDLIDSNAFSLHSFIVRPEPGDNPKILIYYSNKSAENVPINLTSLATTSFDGTLYTALEMGKTSHLQAADSTGLYSSFGETKFNDIWYDNTDAPSLLVMEDGTIDLSDYELPALSMGVIEIELDPLVGLAETEGESTINLFPNPGSNIVQISAPAEFDIQSITIHTLSGELLRSIGIESNKTAMFNVQNLAPGVYLVKIEHANGLAILRFLRS